ncbi:hypothetical protein [uncultured Methanolobus sp.]|uniref:hypothetical protein n=1 Tax=uncultured Methanolobus sp. TaxID=218300 RepID=UPI0029C7F303|nr:hypothetical protein [uncultured Methanolobus sp.]
MKYRNMLFTILLVAVLISGCAENTDITSAVEQLPQIQQFMEEHPDATITVTYWSEEEIAEIQDELSQDFGKTVTPKAMYKAVVSSGDIVSITWIDAGTQIVLYSYTENTNLNKDSNPVEESDNTEPADAIENEDYVEDEVEQEDESDSNEKIDGLELYNGTITKGDGYKINGFVIDVIDAFPSADSASFEVYNDEEKVDSFVINEGKYYEFDFEDDSTVTVTLISVSSGTLPVVRVSVIVTDYNRYEIYENDVIDGGHEYV